MGRNARYFMLRSGGVGVVDLGELAEDLFQLGVIGIGLQGGLTSAESGELEIKGVALGALGDGESAFGRAGHEV